MAAKPKKFWLKERFNPQLGTYWVRMGQMSATAANKCARPIYGSNTMHSFETESEYLKRIGELKAAGESVQ